MLYLHELLKYVSYILYYLVSIPCNILYTSFKIYISSKRILKKIKAMFFWYLGIREVVS